MSSTSLIRNTTLPQKNRFFSQNTKSALKSGYAGIAAGFVVSYFKNAPYTINQTVTVSAVFSSTLGCIAGIILPQKYAAVAGAFLGGAVGGWLVSSAMNSLTEKNECSPEPLSFAMGAMYMAYMAINSADGCYIGYATAKWVSGFRAPRPAVRIAVVTVPAGAVLR